MSTTPVIRSEGISKRYRIGGMGRYLALRDTLTDVVGRPFRRLRGTPVPPRRKRREWFWALDDISFQIGEGEIVGIIGRNGAGKSTLLKILTRITTPTKGRAEIRGRVGSLLEVGTGFHPELTGRENVYFNGGILGMSKREIDRKFDEIIAFAETEQFIDTVVKKYSSGMQVRLAFAVAAHLEPDILLVDEVLTVGDLSFQRKCLNKLAEVSTSGITVMFVSHQLNQIRRLCQRVIWFDEGRIAQDGATAPVVGAYERSASASLPIDGTRASSSATRFLSWELRQEGTPPGHVVISWDPIDVSFKVQVPRRLKSAHTGIALYTADGMLVWGSAVDDVDLEPGVHDLTFTLPSLPLKPGMYRWRVSLWRGQKMLDLWDGLPELLVATEPVTHMRDEWAGLLNLPAKFEARRHP